MADNETIADIIAEMRKLAHEFEDYGGVLVPAMLLDFSDRLEAAHKREKAAIEADALEVGGIVEAAHKRELSKNVSKNGADFGQLGDAAKLREALEALMIDFDSNYADDDDIASWCDVNVEIVRKARAALAAPPRNCDVGTAEEQSERLHAYCKSHRCLYCSSGNGDECKFYRPGMKTDCKLAWAQMPYKEGDAK